MSSRSFYHFSSEISIIGVNPFVPVPDNILKNLFTDAKREKGSIPVKGKINGNDFIQTVVKYQGIWRLYINGIMMKASSVRVGDMISVEITFDPSDRSEKLPQSLVNKFSSYPKVKEEFEKLPPYRKKEILRYLNNLKREETRERNIEKVVKYLSGEKVEGLIALTYKR